MNGTRDWIEEIEADLWGEESDEQLLVDLPPLKPHQTRAIGQIGSLRAEGKGPIVAVAPPGAGKSRIMYEMAESEVAGGGRVIIMAHRKMLIDQLCRGLKSHGIDYGVLSADVYEDLNAPVLIVSAQTLYERAIKRSKTDLPHATLVMKDEAHQQAGKRSRALVFGAAVGQFVIEGYLNRGAHIVGFTATPLMKSRMYSELVDVASYSELRAAGMHQKVLVFGPPEIDCKGLELNSSGEYPEAALGAAVQTDLIFGDVFDHWKRLNPGQLPAIGFAPSVPSSKWFALQFHRRGIPVAHMDGESVMICMDGKVREHPSTRENRDLVLKMSEAREIKVVWNRFVLREAIDMPWLYHGIFATVMGPATGLQAVGRLQRFFAAYKYKIMQDHGGFYWRIGSPNMDREWRLGMTNQTFRKERVERIQSGEEPEGIRCGKCGAWRQSGPVCPGCGNTSKNSIRVVRQSNGRLVQMTGQVYERIDNPKKLARRWRSWLFKGGRSNMTISGVVAAFNNECAEKGIAVNWSVLPYPPPRQNDVRWHWRVSKVYPWTARAAGKQAGNPQKALFDE